MQSQVGPSLHYDCQLVLLWHPLFVHDLGGPVPMLCLTDTTLVRVFLLPLRRSMVRTCFVGRGLRFTLSPFVNSLSGTETSLS